MEITEVRIKLMEDNSGSNERLQAFCSITFDDMFVIRDLKIIEGAKGFFVAMPSRKLTDRCHNCGTKNHLRSRFCNQCGSRLDENRAIRDADGRAKLHADIAHPINSMCREKIQAAVLASYADELERSKMPGYVSRYDDLDGEYELPFESLAPGAAGRPAASRRCVAARSAATPSTPAATSRCSAGRTSRPARRARPRGSAPTAASRRLRQRPLIDRSGPSGRRARPGLARPHPRSSRVHATRERRSRSSRAAVRGRAARAGSAARRCVPSDPDRGATPWRQDAVSWRPRCSTGIRLARSADARPRSSARSAGSIGACSGSRSSSTWVSLAVLFALQTRLIFPGAETQGKPSAVVQPRARDASSST